METKDLKEHIENIINNTFNVIDRVYETNIEPGSKQKKGSDKTPNFNKSYSRLVFPKYRDKKDSGNNKVLGNLRVSEQELRFLFVEQFNNYCNEKQIELFYSIETPTEKTYNFSSKQEEEHIKKPECFQDGNQGQSVQFDLVIFDAEGNRRCLIEFKNNSAGSYEHAKDFLKLSEESKESDHLCYFISIAGSSDGGTIGTNSREKGILPKLKNMQTDPEIKFDKTTYVCHSLIKRGNGFKTIYIRKVGGNFEVTKNDIDKNDKENTSDNHNSSRN